MLELTTLQWVIAAGGVITLLAAGVRWAWPRWRTFWRKANSALDTIGGSEAITDPQTGRELRPAQPPLGTRLGSLEEAVVSIVGVVTEMSELRHHVSNHEGRIKSLEDARVERVVTQAESAAAWSAVAEAQKATPAPPTEETP